MHDVGLELYLIEAAKHAKMYRSELDELSDDLINQAFRSRDYRAAERLLQIFTELCIGLAKHWLKNLNCATTSQAYQTFISLKEQGQISSEDLNTWRKIIGMRNGLVHDYLTIDVTVVENIIINQHYAQLTEFCNRALVYLQDSNKKL